MTQVATVRAPARTRASARPAFHHVTVKISADLMHVVRQQAKREGLSVEDSISRTLAIVEDLFLDDEKDARIERELEELRVCQQY